MVIASETTGIRDQFSSEIKLIKRNYNHEELIHSYNLRIKELEERNRNNEILIDNLNKKIKELEERNISSERSTESLNNNNNNIINKYKYNIEYFKFALNDKKYYFNDNFSRINRNTEIYLSSHEQLLTLKKYRDPFSKTIIYSINLYCNAGNSNKKISVFATYNEPIFYMISNLIDNCISLYNNKDEIITYIVANYDYNSDRIGVSNNYFSADIYNINNFPL